MRTYTVQETGIVRNWKKMETMTPPMVLLGKQIKAMTHSYAQINVSYSW